MHFTIRVFERYEGQSFAAVVLRISCYVTYEWKNENKFLKSPRCDERLTSLRETFTLLKRNHVL